MSNFEYIKDEFPEFYETAVNAESYVFKDTRAAAFYIRLTLEPSVKWLFANDPTMIKFYRTYLKDTNEPSAFPAKYPSYKINAY